MRWYAVFIKGMKEQIRDFWILAMTVIMAPLFIAIYFLMVETETPVYDILLVFRSVYAPGPNRNKQGESH